MILIQIPETCKAYGFTPSGLGTHSSRTMMLEELSLLLSSFPADADFDSYHTAVIDENVLLKPTGATRAKSFRYLRELYGLRTENLLFRTLRLLWQYSTESHPLLAVLCSIARDPLFRTTTQTILGCSNGTILSANDFSNEVNQVYGGSLNEVTLATIGRNAASSWTQSGHLQGRTKKVRRLVTANPTSTAYALFLAFLTGYQGERLFDNDWVKLLDTPTHILRDLAQQAAKQGWLEYRSSGSVTEISFRYFLKDVR